MGYKTEKSAGFLVFFRDGKIRYLFLKKKGKYDIPKGLQQPGEDELTTALRELGEETGLIKIKVIPFFKKTIEYFYRWKGMTIKKKVVYFLGETESDQVKISAEHDGYVWMTKEEILSKIAYRNLKELVEEADRFIVKLNW
ncbi:MAG: NUDIX domain-containing protein [Candidatus Methanomethylicia archaeon]|nr:NUDIX domain-containing protein [Candidatus Methanomethylicia archaeon]MCQ5374530.1 NUDIX domain-containing protein [Candidatus Methanomethylicia archaeon]